MYDHFKDKGTCRVYVQEKTQGVFDFLFAMGMD